jgi:hypothetical protein
MPEACRQLGPERHNATLTKFRVANEQRVPLARWKSKSPSFSLTASPTRRPRPYRTANIVSISLRPMRGASRSGNAEPVPGDAWRHRDRRDRECACQYRDVAWHSRDCLQRTPARRPIRKNDGAHRGDGCNYVAGIAGVIAGSSQSGHYRWNSARLRHAHRDICRTGAKRPPPACIFGSRLFCIHEGADRLCQYATKTFTAPHSSSPSPMATARNAAIATLE